LIAQITAVALVSVLFATQGANDLIDMLKPNDQVPQWVPTKLIEAAKLQARILQPSNFVPRPALGMEVLPANHSNHWRRSPRELAAVS
jgi:hypothetical protein